MISVKHDSIMPELVHCHVNGNGNGARQMSQVQNFVTKEPMHEQQISPCICFYRSFKYEFT